MKFYNREKEIELLKRFVNGKGTRLVVIKGIRRIGKTRLVLEVLERSGKDFLSIFIPRDETTSGFIEFLAVDLNIPRFTSLYDLFKYLFEKYEVIFLDEFQNFYYMDKKIYSYLQKLFDEYKRKEKDLCLLVTGSSYSLMKKIFSDYAKALYGRKDYEITLGEFDIPTIFLILDDLGIKDFENKIKFWAVFGGIPKYYELLELIKPKDFEELMKEVFLKNYKSLLDEGRSILVSEFGGDHKIYFTFLEAISEGKTKISEIASKFNNDVNSANRYANLLKNEYNLISRVLPVFGKKGIYKLNNNFIHFWFRFIKRYENYYEHGKTESITQFFAKNINDYLGIKFEEFCVDLVKKGLVKIGEFTKVGKQWGKTKEGVYEIDLVALDEREKKVLFGEVKWKENVDAKKVLSGLVEKVEHVDWKKKERKESFAIFAKSFKKKMEEFEGKKVYCFDLKDLEKSLRENEIKAKK